MFAQNFEATAGFFETILPQTIEVYDALGDAAQADQYRRILRERSTHDPLSAGMTNTGDGS